MSEERIDRVDGRLDRLYGLLVEHGEQHALVAEGLAELKRELVGIGMHLEQLETEARKRNGRIEHLETAVGALWQRFERVEARWAFLSWILRLVRPGLYRALIGSAVALAAGVGIGEWLL